MIICVVGPTGVGKTRLSEMLAKKYDGIIVNADAMQVYQEMNIGTAKYKKEEDLGNEHYLFNIVSPSQNYTVYDYQKDLRKILEEKKDRNIILVGGTGLYVKAGLYNYEFEERTTAETFDNLSNRELYELLKVRGRLDDTIHINNRKRMVSRLNSNSNHSLKNELLYPNTLFIGLTNKRESLYHNIDLRVDKMIEEGLIEEVKGLYSKYGHTKALDTGIGYKEVIEYLEGNIELDKAIELIKARSRRYAKRQYTWFNNQMSIEWFDVDLQKFENTIEEVERYIDEHM